MKKMSFFLTLIVIMILLIISSCCKKTSPGSQLQIYFTDWLENAEAALAFNFDDNSATHKLVADILSNYQFKGSFFVNPGYSSWNHLKYIYHEISDSGHEIGNHSWSHQNLPTLTTAALDFEVNNPILRLVQDIGVYPVSFVQPFDATNNIVDLAIFENHLFSRISSLYSLENRIRLNLGANSNIQHFTNRLDEALEDNKWLIVTAHNLNTEGDTYLTISPEFLAEICQSIVDYNITNSIWVGTLAEVAHYEYLKEELSASATIKNREIFIEFHNYDFVKYSHLDKSPISFYFKIGKQYSGVKIGEERFFKNSQDHVMITWDLKNSTSLDLKLFR